MPIASRSREINVADTATAFGLVHVVRGDDQRDPLGRQAEEQVPQIAARDRIDAGGRLVEKDQTWTVQEGAHQGEPLLPTAGEPARVTIHVRADAGQFDQFLLAVFGLLRLQAVDAGVEVHVFARREIFVSEQPPMTS